MTVPLGLFLMSVALRAIDGLDIFTASNGGSERLALVDNRDVLDNWGGTACARPTPRSAYFVKAEEPAPTVTEQEKIRASDG